MINNDLFKVYSGKMMKRGVVSGGNYVAHPIQKIFLF
jgi:hypothetical protein